MIIRLDTFTIDNTGQLQKDSPVYINSSHIVSMRQITASYGTVWTRINLLQESLEVIQNPQSIMEKCNG